MRCREARSPASRASVRHMRILPFAATHPLSTLSFSPFPLVVAAAAEKEKEEAAAAAHRSPRRHHSPVRPKSDLRREVVVLTPAMLRDLKEAKHHQAARAAQHSAGARATPDAGRGVHTPRRLLDPVPKSGTFHAAFKHAIEAADAQHVRYAACILAPPLACSRGCA